MGYVICSEASKYESEGIPSLTDAAIGQLRSKITRRSAESFFGTELSGDRTIPSRKGGVVKGPTVL